jgi:aminoglycoside phosphotransferase (APT) family kinase protein
VTSPPAASSSDGLVGRIDAHLAALGVPARARSTAPLGGGACQELIRVELDGDGVSGPWVLRSDARRALPGSITRRQEYAVVRAAAAAGVPTPEARWFGSGLVRPGADAYFLPWARGVAIGAKVVRDPSLAAARARLPEQIARALATVHRVSTFELDLPRPDPGERATDRALRLLRASIAGLAAPRPDLEAALDWLARHAPEHPAVALVHGDWRTGNFLVGPDGLEAVLDWEFARVSSRWEDLGWLCVRDWRFGEVRKPVGGFTDRRTFFAHYAREAGVAVDVAAVHWWEVFGNVSWGAGALWQTQRFFDGEHDLELLAIGRRAAEMGFEALRLIRRGPEVLS